VLSTDVHDHVPSAYAAELLPASLYTFSSIDNIFQTNDFSPFKCTKAVKWLHAGEKVFPHDAEGCGF